MSDVSVLADGLDLTESQIATLLSNLNKLKSAKLLELDADISRTKEGLRLTTNGRNLLAKACAGSKLTFTRVALGDAVKNGEIITPTDEEIVTYTKLINEVDVDLPLTNVQFAGGGACTVTFQINNANFTDGFWAREIGLYAKVDDGKEQLYAYKNTGALSSYLIGGGGAVASNLFVNLITVVDNATNVTAIIDAALIYVSTADFNTHIYSTKPHPNTPCLAAEVSTSDYFWSTGDDMQLRPISSTNLRSLVIGGNLNSLSGMQKRIAQLELNNANLYMQLNKQNENGLDANLLIAEDFIDCAAIDLFDIKVNDEVAGAQNVCVEEIAGIVEGVHYTIADGVHSEEVLVTSVAKNDDLYVVFFDSPLTWSYNLKKTRLYRSTGLISDNKVLGSGDIRESTYNFKSYEWAGESSTGEVTHEIKLTQDNADKFQLKGAYAFTTSAGFTIDV